MVVSGIWPPDPGGPASHAFALSRFLCARGHGVEAITTADAAPAQEAFEVWWINRSLPAVIRHLRCVAVVRKRARVADAVYATTMVRRAALGAAFARRPLVVKLVSDEVFERERRSGRFGGSIDEFQRERGRGRVRLLRLTRDAALRRACHVFCPSEYLRQVAVAWGVHEDHVSVLPNPAPAVPALPPREELRREFALDGPSLGFAGRLVRPKALDVALEAVAASPGVTLMLVGDGPDRSRLEQRARELGLERRARFLGIRSRGDVLRLFRAVDASLLTSDSESFPHSVVEALAVGTPVIATSVGGIPEIVRDGENGLLVPPGEPQAVALAIRRFFADGELRRRLGEAAPGSVAAYTEKAVFTRIEEELVRAARR